MSNLLEQILAGTREEVRERRERVPIESLAPAADRRAHAFADALRAPGLSIIAEHKRRSPSAGEIRPGSSVAEIAAAYERGGAAAMSVLTEQRHFGGTLEDLRAARRASALPLLRKDFIVDEYQLAEARAWGADCILLIVAALQPVQMRDLEQTARALGLAVLVEVHDAAELELALQLRTALIGINNRDLKTFEVSLDTTLDLLPRIGAERLVVAESGILQKADVARLRAAGVNAFLVGEAFMRAPDPGAELARLFG